ncbi:17276_t:CDS:2, partial [Racocetra persica]
VAHFAFNASSKMFLSDAIFYGKTTEPCWFKSIRIVIALGLAIAILFYAFNQVASMLNYYQLDLVIVEKKTFVPLMPNVYLCANLQFTKYKCDSSESYFNASQPCEEISSGNCKGFRFKAKFDENFVIALMSFDITLAPTSSTANVSFNLSEYLDPAEYFNFSSYEYIPSPNLSRIGISDH